jgi:prolyl-tRNA synthetase
VRPTSETIIGAMFAKWVQSYRDLPLLINQWANVVRWEMRTRLFLRTAEFLWQEGHTATPPPTRRGRDDAMLDVYADFAENWMAMPVIQGEKTAGERFPGAVETYCIEAMMQDRKALQAGTSHFLGQNFAKASRHPVPRRRKGVLQHAWTTSWGVSTRLVGALIMTHADDDGLVCPPRLAPAHVVILPVQGAAAAAVRRRPAAGRARRPRPARRRQGVAVDQEGRAAAPRDRAARHRQGLGVRRPPRQGAQGQGVGRPRAEFVATVGADLQAIQDAMLARAKAFRAEHTRDIDSKADFYAYFTPPAQKDPNAPTPIHGGFAMTHFSGDVAVEKQIKDDLGVTVRCIPLGDGEPGTCPFTGKPSAKRVVWAKSY